MIELAYRVAGENWKRRTFKTQTVYDAFMNRLDEKYGLECVETRIQQVDSRKPPK